MASQRDPFDIVICSGAGQMDALAALLPLLRPHGVVHLVSSRLTSEQLDALEGAYDLLHRPDHSPDPYDNFKLFCIRDMHRLVNAPWFVKVDTDVRLAPDWFDYVRECIARLPDTVLFGTTPGFNRLEYHVTGPLVRRKLGADVHVRQALKVDGAFYVARTAFFRQHDATMQALHDVLYAFRRGRRIRPSHLGDEALERDLPRRGLVRARGNWASVRQGSASEDNLRSLTVHVVGAGSRLRVVPSGGRIATPPKEAFTRRALALGWIRRQLHLAKRRRT
jgi:hypothetical protein